jgi:hypothetical protein
MNELNRVQRLAAEHRIRVLGSEFRVPALRHTALGAPVQCFKFEVQSPKQADPGKSGLIRAHLTKSFFMNLTFRQPFRYSYSFGVFKRRNTMLDSRVVTTRLRQSGLVFACIQAVLVFSFSGATNATPANKAALEKHYDKFLAKNLGRCTTCHLPSDNKNPESLEEFPHNPFGARLRVVGKQLIAEAKKKEISARLGLVAREDSDSDGIDNETELLLGYNPGDAQSTPSQKDLSEAKKKRVEFTEFLASYRWQPFETVRRPPVPKVKNAKWVRNPVDAFVAAEQQSRGLKPRPEASKEILLRRVYLDLIGFSPTPEELAAFEKDRSRDAYEKVVERLLADPRYGERWGRHWMDVWRYSDWAGWSGGNQIRDSKPHIWRWRDWIVESLNADKSYSQMLIEMLAADEIAPRDTNVLRATGFLVRNYKMLSREQWLEDTVKHTSQAFLGVTMGCAKCHDHMYDPISQEEYYKMRAVFEPHWVRTDHIPGDTNLMNAGLVRTFDSDTNPPTYLFNRGDERRPDTNRLMQPDVPKAFGGSLDIHRVSLPWIAGHPDKEDFVRRDVLAAADKLVGDALAKLATAKTNGGDTAKAEELNLSAAVARAQRDALAAVLKAEQLEDSGQKDSENWKMAATNAVLRQRELAWIDSKLKLHQATTVESEARKKAEDAAEKLALATNEVQQIALKKDDSLKARKDAGEKTAKALSEAEKKRTEAEKALASAEEKSKSPLDRSFKHRSTDDYPTNSTGRRLAFARWVTGTNNPLTARVAVNQMWLRHFGQGLVPTPQDFGRNGKSASHPQLVDWLASELMQPTVGKPAEPWSMKHIHRLLVTSSTYRMASTPDERNAKIDPDNTFLWRMNYRRMEAEVVRDNLLYVAGDLDKTMGGPDIDHALGMKSKRRSIYLRQAAEKEVEFLKIFDGPAVTECYVRRPTVVPQQALAMANSELTLNMVRSLTKKLGAECGADNDLFARCAFERILARHPRPDELKLCRQFLTPSEGSTERSRENLVSVLFNHNDFITIR